MTVTPTWPHAWSNWRKTSLTVAYWSSLEAIAHWRANAEHRVAQETGKTRWYEHYAVRVALVERAYEGPNEKHAP
jgi:heme-degrading monooxygenase HmoA